MRAATLQVTRTSRHRADSQPHDDEVQALALLGRRRERKISRSRCNALPDIGRDEQKHAPPCRAANKNSADHGEHLTPGFGRDADMREPDSPMVAGDTGGPALLV